MCQDLSKEMPNVGIRCAVHETQLLEVRTPAFALLYARLQVLFIFFEGWHDNAKGKPLLIGIFCFFLC